MTNKTWYDNMMEDALVWVQRERPEAVKIESFESGTEGAYGCDTCSFEFNVVEISYRDTEGVLKYVTFNGELGDLLRELAYE